MSNIPFRLGDKMNMNIESEFFDENLVLDFELNTNTGNIQKTDPTLKGNLTKKWDQFFWNNLSKETEWELEGIEGNYLINDTVFGTATKEGKAIVLINSDENKNLWEDVNLNKFYSTTAQEFEDIFEDKEPVTSSNPNQDFLDEIKKIDDRILKKLGDNDLLEVPKISLDVTQGSTFYF
jgi:hypothetical protein